MMDFITVPFAWLLSFLYDLTNNYGFAMIIFAVLVQLVLLPITAKSKKSTMKMMPMMPKPTMMSSSRFNVCENCSMFLFMKFDL